MNRVVPLNLETAVLFQLELLLLLISHVSIQLRSCDILANLIRLSSKQDILNASP